MAILMMLPSTTTNSNPSLSLSFPTHKQKVTTMNTLETNKTHALIHGLSIQVGQLYAALYAQGMETFDEQDHALEAYKSLRRALPRDFGLSDQPHIGHSAAHDATQGV